MKLQKGTSVSPSTIRFGEGDGGGHSRTSAAKSGASSICVQSQQPCNISASIVPRMTLPSRSC